MSRAGQVWQLRHGDELLGERVVIDGDFPWLSTSEQAGLPAIR
jgi:hypothetical protein